MMPAWGRCCDRAALFPRRCRSVSVPGRPAPACPSGLWGPQDLPAGMAVPPFPFLHRRRSFDGSWPRRSAGTRSIRPTTHPSLSPQPYLIWRPSAGSRDRLGRPAAGRPGDQKKQALSAARHGVGWGTTETVRSSLFVRSPWSKYFSTAADA